MLFGIGRRNVIAALPTIKSDVRGESSRNEWISKKVTFAGKAAEAHQREPLGNYSGYLNTTVNLAHLLRVRITRIKTTTADLFMTVSAGAGHADGYVIKAIRLRSRN